MASETLAQAVTLTVIYGIGWMFVLTWNMISTILISKEEITHNKPDAQPKFRKAIWQTAISYVLMAAAYTLFVILLFAEPRDLSGIDDRWRQFLFRLSNMFVFAVPLFPICMMLWHHAQSGRKSMVFTIIYFTVLGLSFLYELVMIITNAALDDTGSDANGPVMRSSAFVFEGTVFVGLVAAQIAYFTEYYWNMQAPVARTKLRVSEAWVASILLYACYAVLVYAMDSDVVHPNYIDADTTIYRSNPSPNQRGIGAMSLVLAFIPFILWMYRHAVMDLPQMDVETGRLVLVQNADIESQYRPVPGGKTAEGTGTSYYAPAAVSEGFMYI